MFERAGGRRARDSILGNARDFGGGNGARRIVAKLAACLHAIDGGVEEVRIVDGCAGAYIGAPGTTITKSGDREYTKC